MPRRDGTEPLVNCLDIPCPWESCYRTCQFRIAKRGANGFPNAICAFYSTPGPHVPSRIAKATGLSIDSVNKTLDVVHAKVRQAVIASEELRFDPRVRTMIDDHVEKATA